MGATKRVQPKATKQATKEVEAEQSSGSEDLVSRSDEGESDDGESSGDEGEEAPQEAAPDDGEGSDFDELQVDFEFFDLKPVDFHGLRALLVRFLDGELPFALSELVESLIAQGNSVGTVVKANGDVDPLGVVSVLPLDLHRKQPAVQQVLDFLRRKCPDKAAAANLEKARRARIVASHHIALTARAAPRVGLLVSERMINIPPELAPPLVDGLFQELDDIGGEWWWKSEKSPTEALRGAFQFDHFLILTRVYRDDEPAAEAAEAGPAAKKAKQAASAGVQRLIYPKPEDEAFHAHAAWAFTFPAAVPEPSAVADRANKLTQLRLAMCVPASAVKAVQAQTQRLVASFAEQGHA